MSRLPQKPARHARNRTLLAAFAGVAACFLVGTVVSERSENVIDGMAEEIVRDESPSIMHLASARAELHRMQDFASDYVEFGRQASAKSEIEASRAVLEREITAYTSLAWEAGEEELWATIADEIARVNKIVDRSMAAADRGDLPLAHLLVMTDLREAVDQASAALIRDIALNAHAADANATAIERKRRSTKAVALWLDVASVGITAIAALLAIRFTSRLAALNEAHTRLLEEKNSELENFASRMAHDVVSPLASTRLAIDLGLRTTADERVKRLLSSGRAGIDSAVDVAEALLDFARAGARPSSPERASLRVVVAEVVDELAPEADRAGVTLRNDALDDLDVACAHGLLMSVVSNLVRNAIKYMGDRPDQLVVITGAPHRSCVRLEVEDTGPGLPPSACERIFDPYVRGPEQKSSGLGLGLATVKRIALAHGGDVGVESHLGKGARFWVDLPRAA